MRNIRSKIQVILIIIILVNSFAQAKTRMSVLICMIGPQLEYFKQQCSDFEKLEKIDLEIINTVHMDELNALLNSRENIGLFMIPFGTCWSLVKDKKIKPLNDFLTPKEMESFSNEYILTWLGKRGSTQYFLPHKYETRIMVYRKSKVNKALEIWSGELSNSNSIKNKVNEKLRGINGYGLPKNYQLENDPAKWDFFDIFTIGMIWAKTPENGISSARIGHRGKNYSGTALRVIDRVIQCGGDTSIIISMRGPAFEDAFRWEAIYTRYGIYSQQMWSENWTGQDLWKKFGDESIYLSFLTQIDCFFLHGTNNPSMKGYLKNPEDLGFALMPQGCSVALSKEGKPIRTGTHAVTNGGWWWAIPSKWSMPNLSYKFFLYLSSHQKQEEQCRAFGLIPIRNDVVKDTELLFKSGWISEVFNSSYEQIRMNNNHVVPANIHFNRISELYCDLLFKIVNQNNSQGDSLLIEQALFDTYTSKAFSILNK